MTVGVQLRQRRERRAPPTWSLLRVRSLRNGTGVVCWASTSAVGDSALGVLWGFVLALFGLRCAVVWFWVRRAAATFFWRFRLCCVVCAAGLSVWQSVRARLVLFGSFHLFVFLEFLNPPAGRDGRYAPCFSKTHTRLAEKRVCVSTSDEQHSRAAH